ncbi:MAG TPA: OsmC family protein, partial [Anaerolineaceae bacterium]|nr:OsmC family protein [Anaerolineaceae bacterium]
DSGGKDAGPTALEYLFFALASCIVTIGLIKARQERLPVRGIQVKVDGDLNTMVLMGKKTDDRSGFQEIRVAVDVDADMSREEKEKFVQDVELRCPVTDNIKHASSVHFVVA